MLSGRISQKTVEIVAGKEKYSSMEVTDELREMEISLEDVAAAAKYRQRWCHVWPNASCIDMILLLLLDMINRLNLIEGCSAGSEEQCPLQWFQLINGQ